MTSPAGPGPALVRNAFWRILKATERSFFRNIMPMLWIRQKVFHVTFRGQDWGLRAITPYPYIEPPLPFVYCRYTQSTAHIYAAARQLLGSAHIMVVADHENNHRKILDRLAGDDARSWCGWSSSDNISNLWSQPSARENNWTVGPTTT